MPIVNPVTPCYLNPLSFSHVVLVKVKRSTRKFTLQLNQSYYHPQFWQVVISRLQMRIQNPVRYLRRSV